MQKVKKEKKEKVKVENTKTPPARRTKAEMNKISQEVFKGM